MTGAEMPKPGLAYMIAVGFPVTAITAGVAAINWAVNQGAIWTAGRANRRLVRAEERAARHERKAQAWDEFGCDLWDWEP